MKKPEITVEDQKVLDGLKRAVASALERKRRLGQYAVVWRDGRVVKILAEEQGERRFSPPSRE